MSDVGAGQQEPVDSNSDYSVQTFIIGQMLALMDTLKIVQVVAVHGGGTGAPPPTVDVRPLVNQLDGAGNATPHGIVRGVKVLRPQVGGSAIVMDPKVGDYGFVIAADRDSSNVAPGSGMVNPGSYRKYSISDGIYVGGVCGAAPTQWVQFTDTGINIQDNNGNKLVTGPTGWTFTGNVTMENNLQLAGNIEAETGGTYAHDIVTSGEVVAKSGVSQVHLSTHTHTQGNDSHGDVEQPTSAPTGGS